MLDPLEIEGNHGDNNGDNNSGHDGNLEEDSDEDVECVSQVMMPLVPSSDNNCSRLAKIKDTPKSLSINSCSNRQTNRSKRLPLSLPSLGSSKTRSCKRMLPNTRGVNSNDHDENDENDRGLSLFVWICIAVVAALIVYNIKHLTQMEEAAGEELEDLTRSGHNYTTDTTQPMHNDTILHPPR